MTTTQPTYNLCDVRSLLHSHAYGSERSEPAKTTIEQYGDFCQHMQTVENTATDLKNIGAGLYLLIGLLEDSARMNIDPLVGRAFRGLLQPLCSDIERHAAALQSAVTREI